MMHVSDSVSGKGFCVDFHRLLLIRKQKGVLSFAFLVFGSRPCAIRFFNRMKKILFFVTCGCLFPFFPVSLPPFSGACGGKRTKRSRILPVGRGLRPEERRASGLPPTLRPTPGRQTDRRDGSRPAHGSASDDRFTGGLGCIERFGLPERKRRRGNAGCSGRSDEDRPRKAACGCVGEFCPIRQRFGRSGSEEKRFVRKDRLKEGGNAVRLSCGLVSAGGGAEKTESSELSRSDGVSDIP